MTLDVHFSSATDEWATPQDLFDKLNEEFNFSLDVCADDWNHKTQDYFDKTVDGLAQQWTGVCWCNPPYGREIGKWMQKAYESAGGGGQSLFVSSLRAQTQHGGTTTPPKAKFASYVVESSSSLDQASRTAHPFPAQS